MRVGIGVKFKRAPGQEASFREIYERNVEYARAADRLLLLVDGQVATKARSVRDLVCRPIAIAGAVVLFLLYVCCSPGSAPSAEQKERPHSFASTSQMLDNEKDD